MFFQLLYIHLFRPFLKYNQSTSPLPAHVSPRKICTQAAGTISKLLRLYKRSHGLRQIVNFAVYIAHSACIIHLLNLPDKTAKRDIVHGVKHLEEIADSWLAARRTLAVLELQARKWKIELPEEATVILARTLAKFGSFGASLGKSPIGLDAHSPPAQNQIAEQMLMEPQHSNLHQQAKFDATDGLLFGTEESIHAGSMGPPQGNYSTSGHYTNHPFLSQHQNLSSPSKPNLDPTQPQPQPQQPTATNAFTTKRQYSTIQNVPQVPQVSINPNPATTRTIKPTRQSMSNLSSSDLFGGVEALLREGQDWWMRDQSTDLASGFGNWRNTTTTTTNHTPSVASGGMEWAQQGQQRNGGGATGGESGMSRSQTAAGGVGGREDGRRSSIGFWEGGGGGGLGSGGGGVGSGNAYGFGHLSNQYDESEWYQ